MFNGIGMYGVSNGDEDDYITQVEVVSIEHFSDILDEMKNNYGDDIRLIKMEA